MKWFWSKPIQPDGVRVCACGDQQSLGPSAQDVEVDIHRIGSVWVEGVERAKYCDGNES